jgi:hypothetical protein
MKWVPEIKGGMVLDYAVNSDPEAQEPLRKLRTTMVRRSGTWVKICAR